MATESVKRQRPIYLLAGGAETSRAQGVVRRNEKLKLILSLVILLPLLGHFCFGNLDTPSFQHRDETTHVRVTQEMWMTGDVLHPRVFGVPYYNKPPFKMWLSLIPISLFGESNASYRMLDGLAGAGTVLLVFFFTRALFGSTVAGFFAAVALLTCRAYAVNHGYRTANQDSLLIFFTTLTSVLGWKFLETAADPSPDRGRRLYRLAACGGLITGCAFLTKNVAGFLPLGFLGLFVLLRGGLRAFLVTSWKPLFLFGVIACAIPLAYVIPRCLDDSGACIVMFEQEVVTRATVGYHNTQHPEFYLKRLFIDRVAVPPFLIVVGIFFALWHIFARRDRRSLFLLCWSIVPIALFTAIPSRLTWYIAPAYPALAILAGAALAQAYRQLITQGSRWWRGRSPLEGRTIAAGAVLLCGTIFLLQHAYELHDRVASPLPRIPLDLLSLEMREAIAADPARRLLVYRAPELARNENVYRDMISPVYVKDEAELRRELERGGADFILTEPRHFSLIHRLRPVAAYRFLEPYRARTHWLLVASLAPVGETSSLTPSQRFIDFGSADMPFLYGWRPSEQIGTITIRRSKGPHAAVLLEGDLATRSAGATVRFNLARTAKVTGAPLMIQLSFNGIPVGALGDLTSNFDTYSLWVPAELWRSGRNVLSLAFVRQGSEALSPGDEAIAANWVSVDLGGRPL